jgi:hypothetical protein
VADFTLVEKHLDTPNGLVDMAAVADEPGVWVAVDGAGSVTRLDTIRDRSEQLCIVDLPAAEPERPAWDGNRLASRLHLSRCGRFAAIVHDFGRNGKVYDLATGATTMTLDGGDYLPETVRFSCVFVERDGRAVLIHRTAWNRLDASVAATGELLTDRGPTSYREGEERPAHYLDYFHGALYVSPDGRHVVDDGWMWHPVGIPVVWSVDAWLGGNVWESEDGASRTAVGERESYWNHAICWIDDHRFAVAGIGDEYEPTLDGARVMSASPGRKARCLQELAGPSGRFFSDGARLLSVDDEGLSMWDLESGRRTGGVEGVRPTHQHPTSRELVLLTGRPSRLLIWRS